MADKAPRNNAHCTIPDDPDQSTYRFIIVAAKRARQLQGGARPVLPTSSKKPTVIAMEEVRRGLVKYSLTGQAPDAHHAGAGGVRGPQVSSTGMKIILGIGGGIAAYKAAELARLLMQEGHEVQAVMTAAAQEFVRPLTFAALTGRKVLTDLFAIESAIEHIAVAQEHEAAGDRAGHRRPDRQDGARSGGRFSDHPVPGFHRPGGARPCHERQHVGAPGDPGQPRDAAPARPPHRRAGERVPGLRNDRAGPPGRPRDHRRGHRRESSSRRRDLEGETVLITAGPTQEPLDPVRYISNRSSGKMGYALAEAAAARGARVILISGPVHLAPPHGVEVVPVRTAVEMREKVFENLGPAGIVIKAAAVADFHLSKVPDQKVKKTAARISLELDPTPDILAELGRKKGDRLLIGFAAETQNLQQEARRKLESKNCDMVVGNLVGASDSGFESDHNEVILVHADRRDRLPAPRAQTRNRRPHFQRGPETAAGARTPPMDAELLRRYLEFYQDLGIKTLYRQPKTMPAAPSPEHPVSVRRAPNLPALAPRGRKPAPNPRRHRRLPALPVARAAHQDRLRRGQ